MIQPEIALSSNIQIVEAILKALAKVRTERNGWYDSEEETIELESLAFKIGESLRPFLIAQNYFPDYFTIFPLEKEIIIKDINKVLISIKNNGFYPSPYSPIPEVDDQYTDFAAFCLEFSDLVFRYSQMINSRKLNQLSQITAKKALTFLIDNKNYLDDDFGCRWAGTNLFLRERKIKEYYTDTYFTSLVIIALRKVLESPALALSEREKDKIRGLLRKSGKWIINRVDLGLITGDEKKTNKKLIYTTWGLRALIETYDTQEESVRKQISPIITAFLKEVDNKLDRDTVSLGQEYLTILSPTVEEPLYYEDRSDWGGIFLTLVSLRKLPEIDTLLESTNYKQIIDAVYNGLMLLRNPFTKLWYKDKFILSIHSYLTEGFLLYEKQAKDFGLTLGVTSGMIRTAIRETLKDDAILSSLQHLVYSKLLATSRQAKESEIIDREMDKIKTSSEKKISKKRNKNSSK